MLKVTLYLKSKYLVILKVWIQGSTDKPEPGSDLLSFGLRIMYPGYFPSSEKTKILNISNYLISSRVCSGLVLQPYFPSALSLQALISTTMLVSSVTEGILYSDSPRGCLIWSGKEHSQSILVQLKNLREINELF